VIVTLPLELLPPEDPQPARASPTATAPAAASRHRDLALSLVDVRMDTLLIRSLADFAHPLTDPTVRPEAIYRWAAMSKTAAGSSPKTHRAMAAPRFSENSPM